MQHETASVKKKVKSYKLKDGAEKESISYTINLGVNSKFNDDDKVAVIPIDDFNEISGVTANEIVDLKNIIADKDATITANTKIIDELNEKVENDSILINDLTDKLNGFKKTVADLGSDVSAKDKKISELESELRELKSKVAVFDTIDISDLQKKADELDKSKNVIIKLQREINEYLLLVNFKDKKIDALKNKGVLDTLFGKDVTGDIVEPTLYLIDKYGNPIADPDNVEPDATANSDDNDVTESKHELK